MRRRRQAFSPSTPDSSVRGRMSAPRSHSMSSNPSKNLRKPTATTLAIDRIEEALEQLPRTFAEALDPQTPKRLQTVLREIATDPSLELNDTIDLSNLFRADPSMCQQYLTWAEVNPSLKDKWIASLVDKCRNDRLGSSNPHLLAPDFSG